MVASKAGFPAVPGWLLGALKSSSGRVCLFRAPNSCRPWDQKESYNCLRVRLLETSPYSSCRDIFRYLAEHTSNGKLTGFSKLPKRVGGRCYYRVVNMLRVSLWTFMCMYFENGALQKARFVTEIHDKCNGKVECCIVHDHSIKAKKHH